MMDNFFGGKRMRKARSDATREYYVAVGKKIAEVRQRRNITQEALASDISLSRTSVVNIERGKQQLLLHTFVQIAQALKSESHELLPDFVPGTQPILKAISLVQHRKGRAWIEKSVKSAMKNS